MQNEFVESFNGRLREECLNEHLFGNLDEARKIIENWRIDYNIQLPHTSLGGPASVVFANLNRTTQPASHELCKGSAHLALTATISTEKTGTDTTPRWPGSGGWVTVLTVQLLLFHTSLVLFDHLN